ncbi:hypothetical protein [Tautonia marina]|uniref:hypothetical protein n=1 Tax=Tautonia marina TaxID=2653855 RepID=UPI00191C6E97|nr:hypothetical protein [Tautonia marina]
MDLFIAPGGRVRGRYAEAIDLAALGAPRIVRAGVVDPDLAGRWFADLSLVGGPVLGPFATRSAALAAEEAWLARVLLGDRGGGLDAAPDPLPEAGGAS